MDNAPCRDTPAIGGPERSPRRDRLHLVGLAVPWALVLLLWWRVLQPGGPVLLVQAGALVGACAVLTVALTVAWISHNVAINRAKGPRTGLPSGELCYDRDWSGRPVVADWASVRTAPLVFVAGARRHKTFVAALEPAGRSAGGTSVQRPAAVAVR